MAGSGSLCLDEARRLVSVLSDEERLSLSRAISDVTSYQTDHEGTNQTVRELEIIINYFYANNLVVIFAVNHVFPFCLIISLVFIMHKIKC